MLIEKRAVSFQDFLDFSVPLYLKEGKSQLVIAFGCTGGKHRSVTFAELVCNYLKEKNAGTFVTITREDLTLLVKSK